MGRNVVVCCDGTANSFARHNTNVVKLYSALVDDPARQAIFYHPGVGTMEAPGALTGLGRRLTILAGQAIGYGLERDIAAAYTFIMNTYREADGDRLYLFGFSRGGFTARAIAALLHLCGILRPGHESSIPYAIRMMNAMGRHGATFEQDEAVMKRFRETFSTGPCKPHFVGLWDTVSSVGWISDPLVIPYVTTNPDIQIARHAMALDERRAFYRQNLWRRGDRPETAGPVDLRQVWFMGNHCDVGGGYPEDESGLSKIPLRWMFREAEAAGLLVDPRRRDAVIAAGHGPDPDGIMHDELEHNLFWKAAEYVPKRHFDYRTGTTGRRCNRGRRRWLQPGSVIHASAWERKGYAPPQVPQGTREE